jgi:2,3,4,5-tetrahydropyridine-2,6-dicarboxylate N-succinyltransferase
MSSSNIYSLGFGLATRNSKKEIIEVFYPNPLLSPSQQLGDAITAVCNTEDEGNGVIELQAATLARLNQSLTDAGENECAELLTQLEGSEKSLILCILKEDSAPANVAEAYLKLHLLSHRLIKPHGTCLDGLFAVLHNIAWTNRGAIDLEDLPEAQLKARLNDELLEVMSVDKFPKMSSYVTPKGVRIAHTARVRLGAYLGEGTTVMHEGFVNFNAGTEGPAMIEGRISAGVMVGANSDLGGGCSTMGTLSGGGKEIITVGKNCLVGANAGIGVPLADGCIVEAGLYVTAGTKLELRDNSGKHIKTCKAVELSGVQDLLYRRNSLSGGVECVPLNASVSLNEELHSHN